MNNSTETLSGEQTLGNDEDLLAAGIHAEAIRAKVRASIADQPGNSVITVVMVDFKPWAGLVLGNGKVDAVWRASFSAKPSIKRFVRIPSQVRDALEAQWKVEVPFDPIEDHGAPHGGAKRWRCK